MDNANLAANSGGTWQGILDNLLQVGQTYLTLQQQKQLNQINVERARNNLPPLSASEYGLGVQVGTSSDTKRMVYIGLAALAGIVVLNRVLK